MTNLLNEQKHHDPRAKVGLRIRIVNMVDEDGIDEGMEGVIKAIDSMGTLHVKWDDGSTLGVIPGLDEYILIVNQVTETTIKPILNSRSTDSGKKFNKNLKKTTSKVKIESEEIPGGNSKGMTLDDLAKKHDTTIEKIEKELEIGVGVEMEHTKSKKIAKEITMDHIFEFPDYYSNKRYGVKASEKGLEKELDEITSAGGGGGLSGADGYAYSTKLESKTIKVSDLLSEITTSSNISAPTDFITSNLLGWADMKDISPVWPSKNKLADNQKHEDWWWQKIPTYNDGVITDPYAKTDDVWDDDVLTVGIDQDVNSFRTDIEKNKGKYSKKVITTKKAFDVNINQQNLRWLNNDSNSRIVNIKENKKPLKELKVSEIPEKIKTSWNKFVEVAKREKKETLIAVKILKKVLKKEEISEKEVKFLKAQSKDLVKIVGVMALGSVSMVIPITLDKLLGKYGISIMPKNNQEILGDDKPIEEETNFSSVFGGGFPSTPFMFAKKGKHIPSKKSLWKGGKIIQKISKADILGEDSINEINKIKFVKNGKFVKIKDKCSKYNNQKHCSQGAIDNPLMLSDTTMESIKKLSKTFGLNEGESYKKIQRYLIENDFDFINEIQPSEFDNWLFKKDPELVNTLGEFLKGYEDLTSIDGGLPTLYLDGDSKIIFYISEFDGEKHCIFSYSRFWKIIEDTYNLKYSQIEGIVEKWLELSKYKLGDCVAVSDERLLR